MFQSHSPGGDSVVAKRQQVIEVILSLQSLVVFYCDTLMLINRATLPHAIGHIALHAVSPQTSGDY